MNAFKLYDTEFSSRLLLGTAGYPSGTVLQQALQATHPAMITAAVRRQGVADNQAGFGFWNIIKDLNIPILPNTAGCQSVEEAVATAEMAREIFSTDWIKLEIIGDDDTLQPDVFQLVKASNILINKGFNVLPYCTEDLIVCRRLIDAGCRALMPWAAPIGSALGVVHEHALQTLRERLPDTPLIIDAGLGLPSHATQVMEWGFDGVLLNSAVALSGDPVGMATAFDFAIKAGRLAYFADPLTPRKTAKASTPTVGQPFWHSAEY